MIRTSLLKQAAVAAAMFVVSVMPQLIKPAVGQEKEAPRLSAAEFEKLHKLIKPQAGESRWMEIDWYPSVWEARQRAAKEGKPLLLWAGSGGAPAAGGSGGTRGGREPSGWTDARIKLIKENFIAATVPTDMRGAKNPEGDFLRGAGIDSKQWVTSANYLSCVSASGKLLSTYGPSAKVLEDFRKLPEAERKPGAVVVPDLEPAERVIPAPPEGGLILKVYGRFLSWEGKDGLRHAKREDFPRGVSAANSQPNTEYMWLTGEEWQALVPAKPVKGDKLAVAPTISERMARFHLSPPRALTGEDGIVSPKAIKKAVLTLVVDDVTPDRIRLGLEGHVQWGSDFDAAKDALKAGMGFTTQLHGILEYDRVKKAFVRFDIAAPGQVWGSWGEAKGAVRDGRTPIGFAFELANGESPRDRIPPGGHGGRALKAGYFTTAK